MSLLLIAGPDWQQVQTIRTKLQRLSCGSFQIVSTASAPVLNDGRIGAPVFNPAARNAYGPLSSQVQLPVDACFLYVENTSMPPEFDPLDIDSYMAMWWLNTEYDIIALPEPLSKNGSQETEAISRFFKELDLYWADYRETCKEKLSSFHTEKEAKDPHRASLHKELWQTAMSQMVHPSWCLDLAGKEGDFGTIADFVDFFQARSAPKDSDDLAYEEKPLFHAPTSSYTLAASGMGFGDFYVRMALLYDFMRSTSTLAFLAPDYYNQHVEDIDFNALVQLQAPVIGSAPIKSNSTVNFDEFVFGLMTEADYLQEHHHYSIFIRNPGKRRLPQDVLDLFSKGRRLFDLTSIADNPLYKNSFSDMEDAFKVVYHLRRHDTTARAFEGVLSDELIRKSAAARHIFSFEDCDFILSTYLALNQIQHEAVEIIMVSDGMEDMVDRLFKKGAKTETPARLQDAKRICEEMQAYLLSGQSTLANATVSKRIIGRDKEKTLETIQAIKEADLVITPSAFPRVIANIANVPAILAHKIIDKMYNARDDQVELELLVSNVMKEFSDA